MFDSCAFSAERTFDSCAFSRVGERLIAVYSQQRELSIAACAFSVGERFSDSCVFSAERTFNSCAFSVGDNLIGLYSQQRELSIAVHSR